MTFGPPSQSASIRRPACRPRSKNGRWPKPRRCFVQPSWTLPGEGAPIRILPQPATCPWDPRSYRCESCARDPLAATLGHARRRLDRPPRRRGCTGHRVLPSRRAAGEGIGNRRRGSARSSGRTRTGPPADAGLDAPARWADAPVLDARRGSTEPGGRLGVRSRGRGGNAPPGPEVTRHAATPWLPACGVGG